MVLAFVVVEILIFYGQCELIITNLSGLGCVEI